MEPVTWSVGMLCLSCVIVAALERHEKNGDCTFDHEIGILVSLSTASEVVLALNPRFRIVARHNEMHQGDRVFVTHCTMCEEHYEGWARSASSTMTADD